MVAIPEAAAPLRADLREALIAALEPHWINYGDHPTGGPLEWAGDMADIVLAALSVPEREAGE